MNSSVPKILFAGNTQGHTHRKQQELVNQSNSSCSIHIQRWSIRSPIGSSTTRESERANPPTSIIIACLEGSWRRKTCRWGCIVASNRHLLEMIPIDLWRTFRTAAIIAWLNKIQRRKGYPRSGRLRIMILSIRTD